ncbi:MAG: MFS transporter [Aerococcus sp.]|nr:MFS transporter [Aerococcus sp.]
MTINKTHWLFKISLLSLSFFLMMAPQISTALPLMLSAFPLVDQANVEALVTIPNVGILIGLFLNPFLVRIIGRKATVLVGLVITLLAGAFPIVSAQFWPIFGSRLLLGAGIGLYNSFAVSLIGEFYRDDEETLATMLGYQIMTGAIGGAVSSFLVSFLLTLGWHAAFAIYLLAVPAIILFGLFVSIHDEKQGHQNGKHASLIAAIHQLNSRVWIITGLALILYILFLPTSYKLPVFVSENQLGTSSQLAQIMAVATLMSIPIGLFFGRIYKYLKDRLFPLSLGLITIGYVLLAFAQVFWMVMIGLLVMYFGFFALVTYLYNWLSWAAPEGSLNLATTAVLISTNLGVFISPYVMNGLTHLFGGQSSRLVLILGAIGFLGLAIYAAVHYLSVHKH